MTDPFFLTPSEQHLTAKAMATRTTSAGDDPPTFGLVLDVVHDETHTEWRQEIALPRSKAIELTQLMDHSLTQIGIDWRPSDHADFTPPEE